MVISRSHISLVENSVIEIAKMLFSDSLNISDVCNKLPQMRYNEVKVLFNQLYNAGVIQPLTQRNVIESNNSQSKVLSAWISITENCSLSCAYCFKPKGSNVLSSPISDSIINSIYLSVKKYRYKVLDIIYSGGEPLLYFERLSNIHQLAENMSKNAGIKYRGTVATNGIHLNQRVIDGLKREQLNIIVSLDSLSKQRTGLRRTSKGESSNRIVKKNIEAAVSSGLSPFVSITVSNENAEDIPPLTEWLLSMNIHFGFSLYKKPAFHINDVGFDANYVLPFLEESYKLIEQSLLKYNEPIPNVFSAKPRVTACAAGKDYLVFDSQGALYSCPMQVNPINSDENSDPIKTIQKDSNPGFNLTVDEKGNCRDCDVKYICAGGCPVNTFHSKGTFKVESPHCKVYKKIIPVIIKLEGLKMLLANKKSL